jgi:RHS repeat-associated protein
MASAPVYNSSNQMTSLAVGSQITENYSFDPKTGLLVSQQVNKGPDQLVNLQYNYTLDNDSNNNGAKTGQLTSVTDQKNTARNRAYEYDKLGRLGKVKGGVDAFSNPAWHQNYTYDRYGNRTGVTKTGEAPQIPLDGLASLGFNTANNRINTAGFEYDPAGNQTRAVINDGGTQQQYRYDCAGRLAQVLDASGNVVATHSYGASNQRLVSVEGGVTRYFAWDGGQTIAEFEASGANALVWKTSYVYLVGRLLATTSGAGGTETRFHHPDRLGTRLVTGADGTVVSEQLGLPFGTMLPFTQTYGGENSYQHPTLGNPSKKRFTSYDRSEATGLDYAVNRFYSSQQGRFAQVDPIGMGAVSLGNPQSLNLFSYVQNDPVNFVDPTGMNSCWAPDGSSDCDRIWDWGFASFMSVVPAWWGEILSGGGGGIGGGSSESNTEPQERRETDCSRFVDAMVENIEWNIDFSTPMLFGFFGTASVVGHDLLNLASSHSKRLGHADHTAGGFQAHLTDGGQNDGVYQHVLAHAGATVIGDRKLLKSVQNASTGNRKATTGTELTNFALEEDRRQRDTAPTDQRRRENVAEIANDEAGRAIGADIIKRIDGKMNKEQLKAAIFNRLCNP